jgi:hypothetical protein
MDIKVLILAPPADLPILGWVLTSTNALHACQLAMVLRILEAILLPSSLVLRLDTSVPCVTLEDGDQYSRYQLGVLPVAFSGNELRAENQNCRINRWGAPF